MEACSEFWKADGWLGIETDAGQKIRTKSRQEIVTGQDFPENPEKNETRTVASYIAIMAVRTDSTAKMRFQYFPSSIDKFLKNSHRTTTIKTRKISHQLSPSGARSKRCVDPSSHLGCGICTNSQWWIIDDGEKSLMVIFCVLVKIPGTFSEWRLWTCIVEISFLSRDVWILVNQNETILELRFSLSPHVR